MNTVVRLGLLTSVAAAILLVNVEKRRRRRGCICEGEKLTLLISNASMWGEYADTRPRVACFTCHRAKKLPYTWQKNVFYIRLTRG
jgi:hypothetical protein